MIHDCRKREAGASHFYFMKSLKLIACLVAFQLVGGASLLASEHQAFREWSSADGRTMTARLLSLKSGMVKVEREDGQTFTLSVKALSESDQAYLEVYQAEEAERLAALPKFDENGLADASKETWSILMACGNHPAAYYEETPLSDILKEINLRMRVGKYKTSKGKPLRIRTEPQRLAGQIQVSGQTPSMSTSDFIKKLVYVNKLHVKIDRDGAVVLVSDGTSLGTFFGTPIK